MADHHEKIAVLGAGGTMGFAMARNLARAGFEVRAWNRSREKAEPLSQDGVQVTDSPREAADGATIVLTMLPDADAVLETMQAQDGPFTSNGADGAVWLQMSTVGEEGTDRCLELARDRGCEFVDAPVLGTREPAEQGKLVVLASGSQSLQDRLGAVFEVLGQRTMWVGEAGEGTRLKIATNCWLVAVVEGAAETLALAQGMGLDPHLVLEAMEGGPLDMPYLQMKGKAMIDGQFEPSFKLALAAKDAGLAERSAERHELDLPLVSTIRGRLEQGIPEHGDADMAATFLTSAPAEASAAS